MTLNRTITILIIGVVVLLAIVPTVKAYKLEEYISQIEESSPRVNNEAIKACSDTTINKTLTEKVLCATFLRDIYYELKFAENQEAERNVQQAQQAAQQEADQQAQQKALQQRQEMAKQFQERYTNLTSQLKTEDDGYTYPNNATTAEQQAKIDLQERFEWEEAGRPGEPIIFDAQRLYCDQLENRTGIICHDRYDASDVTGLYTCRNFTHTTDPLACK